MPSAPAHMHEAARLATLRACGILDSDPETGFDDAAQLASVICGTPIALVTLVDEQRQWFKARVGMDETETPRRESMCAYAVSEEQTVVVEDARQDPRFSDMECVLAPAGIVSYAGAVVRAPNGLPLGTICVADHKPRTLTAVQIQGLEALARQIGALIASRQNCAMLEQYAVELSEARLHLEVQTSALEDANEKLSVLASTDGLTGIANRRLLTHRLHVELDRCSVQRPVSILMLDIDDFKGFNDTFGHAEGDTVLKQVAGILSRSVRPGDLVARFGGEEFCAVLPGATATAAFGVAERIRLAIEKGPWTLRSITVSVGVASATRPGGADTLMEDADSALYASKRGGRNRTSQAARQDLAGCAVVKR